jgi:hypothetical protein
MKQIQNRGWVWVALLGLALLIAIACLSWVLSSQKTTREAEVDQENLISTNIPLKIIVDQAGVYEVSFDELKKNGFDITSMDLSSIQLSSQQRSVPFWVDEKQNALKFYGLPSSSRYSQNNIYWLKDASQQKETSPATPSPVDSLEPNDTESKTTYSIKNMRTSIHLEENLHYNPKAGSGDPWLWQNLTAPQSWSFQTELENLTSGSGQLRMRIWGGTEAPLSPDHHLLMSINNQEIVNSQWDGKGWKTIQQEIKDGVLKSGVNELKVELPGDTGALADTISIDWIEIDYPVELVATNDRLDFTSIGGQVVIRGFSSPVDVIDISQADSPILIGEGLNHQDGISTLAGHRYLIVGENGIREPVQVVPVLSTPDLRIPAPGAEYLAIGPSELLQAMQPLLELRETQGLRTMAIPVQAIYDQFGVGMPEPRAIRDFIDFANQNWELKPRFLTLIGDASFDPRGFHGPARTNQLPTFFVQTRFGGETASDFGFAVQDFSHSLSGSNIKYYPPDIAVGRIPAQSTSQVNDYVQKVLHYEAAIGPENLTEAGSKHLLAIADGSESSFTMDAENFIRSLPKEFTSELITSADSDTEFYKKIQEKVDEGTDLVIYFGHGAINTWGKDRLFANENVKDLQNQDYLPILLQLTCLTGLFTHPDQESLSESFLLQPKTGAVAVLAPTSLTLPEEQSYLSYALIAEMNADPQARLGEILRRAQTQILAENPDAREVVETFLLLGDPALKINPGAAP